jgi:hypothetical protein
MNTKSLKIRSFFAFYNDLPVGSQLLLPDRGGFQSLSAKGS